MKLVAIATLGARLWSWYCLLSEQANEQNRSFLEFSTLLSPRVFFKRTTEPQEMRWATPENSPQTSRHPITLSARTTFKSCPGGRALPAEQILHRVTGME
jgi:hypothetical protein